MKHAHTNHKNRKKIMFLPTFMILTVKTTGTTETEIKERITVYTLECTYIVYESVLHCT